ncbi:MAG TPA: archaellin/type IV pilin N-terminal domain-containing protein [archaeon]|nr:archaellin/type IV pilin N-terminal domain-containing protein [archaeon]
MRGITQIIATILLLMIAIAIIGFSYIFLSGIMSESSQETETQLFTSANIAGDCIRIENINDNEIYVRKCGLSNTTSLEIYI